MWGRLYLVSPLRHTNIVIGKAYFYMSASLDFVYFNFFCLLSSVYRTLGAGGGENQSRRRMVVIIFLTSTEAAVVEAPQSGNWLQYLYFMELRQLLHI